MSAIASEWTPSETEAPTLRLVKNGRKYRREEEFRCALEAYVADYAEFQWRRSETIGSTVRARPSGHGFLGRIANWLRRQLAVPSLQDARRQCRESAR